VVVSKVDREFEMTPVEVVGASIEVEEGAATEDKGATGVEVARIIGALIDDDSCSKICSSSSIRFFFLS
jgi:hypothetical protein